MTSLTMRQLITHRQGGLPSLSHCGWEDISQKELKNIVMHHSKVDHCDIKYLSLVYRAQDVGCPIGMCIINCTCDKLRPRQCI